MSDDRGSLKPGWLAKQIEEIASLNGHWCYQHGKACIHVEDVKKVKMKKEKKT